MVDKLKDILVGAIVLIIVSLVLFFLCTLIPSASHARSPKAKFYDFSEQLIDGEVKKPTTLYTDARDKVKFERLLRLKKSFMDKLFDTSKEKVFK